MISLVRKLFGLRKGMIFAMFTPLLFFSRSNRRIYDLLGRCETSAFGKKVILPHPEARFIDEIVLKQSYTPSDEFRILDGMNVLDAGANVGIFTLYAALQTPHGQVIAIEPDPINFRYLEENLAVNGLKNVVLVNAALSNQQGNIRLGRGNPGSMTIMNAGSAKGEIVKAVTMQEILEANRISRIDLCKVDIEGAEFLIFQEDSWLSRVDRLVMEVHPVFGKTRVIIDKLRNKGFRVSTSDAYDPDTIYVYAAR